MDTYETIMTRRSVRKFTSGEVGDDLVEKLLRAAMQAPSANNGQPWHFIVIRDRAILDEIPSFHPFAQMVKQAPLAILVCADTRDERSPDYWVLDCSAATENLLLAAHALDLGAVWLGIHPRQERMEKIIPLVKLPEGVKPLALVAIGIPAEHHPFADRFKPERIHHDTW
jgi:nitroreductase